ncbi:MAG TPA: DUF6519 domain-containing protein [Paucimonas sp.]|nr:DUF6519 domain-containing protein [Paucimonas sp.]
MKGDFTRDTFDPFQHYTRVLMQQGRVQLDADWNEQAALAQHYLQALAADLIGRHGGPKERAGFAVLTNANGLTDRWGRPLDQARIDALNAELAAGGFIIGGGRYYVTGLLCESDEPTAYSAQAGYPFDAATALDKLRDVNDTFLIYLDVWERHVSFVEAEGLRETALGGPDTATRAQRVCQVKVMLPVDGAALSAASLDSLPRIGKASMRARAKQPEMQADACIVSPQARFRGAENQLYRIEIHRGGSARAADASAGGATFKWSRENGSVIFPVLDIGDGDEAGTTIVTLAALGRDDVLGLRIGDRVELVDDDYTLQQRADPLLKVRAIDRDELQVVLEGIPAHPVSDDPERHPLLRRWDHDGDPGQDTDDGALLVRQSNADWIDLEDGVQIQFPATYNGQDAYRSGDYWLVPARAATMDVDWPQHKEAAGWVPSALPPRGVAHDYAPLALAAINAQGRLEVKPNGDMRRFFEALAKV